MSERHAGNEQKNRELLEALETLNSQRTLAVVQRTRRNVMDAAHRRQAEHAQSRQRLGVALLVIGILLVLATPALWGLSEAALSGDEMAAAAIFTLTIFVMLMSAAMGAAMSRGPRRLS